MVRGLPPSIRAIVQTLWLTGGDGLALSGGRASMSAAMGWSARAGVCLVVAAALTACAGVTRSGGDYRLKAQKTVTDLTAVVGSAQLAGRQYLAGRLPQSYADDVISRAEQDGSSIQNAFDTRQPPDS